MGNPFLVDDNEQAPQVNPLALQTGMPPELQRAVNTRSPYPRPQELDKPGVVKKFFTGYLDNMTRALTGRPSAYREQVKEQELALEQMQQRTARMNAEALAGQRAASAILNEQRGQELEQAEITAEEAQLMGNPALAGVKMNAKAKAAMMKGQQAVTAAGDRQKSAQEFAAKQQKGRFDQQWGLEKFRQGKTDSRMHQRARIMMEMAAGGDIESAAGLWTDAIANNEAKITEVPMVLRTFVLQNKGNTGSTFVSQKNREKLADFNKATVSLKAIEDKLEDYLSDPSPSKAFQYSAALRGFSSLNARALGHTGVLTEIDLERTDKAVNAVPITPMLSPMFPDLARQSLETIKNVMSDARDKNFGSLMGNLDRAGNQKGSNPSGGVTPPKGATIRKWNQL